MAFKVKNADWRQDKHRLTGLREKVFVCEWRIPYEAEFDQRDQDAYHVLVLDEQDRAIGTARITHDGEIGRIAVIPERRGKAVYRKLRNALVRIALEHSISDISVSCELEGVPYFQQQGFRPVGSVFMDAGIPRQKMVCPAEQFSLPRVEYTH